MQKWKLGQPCAGATHTLVFASLSVMLFGCSDESPIATPSSPRITASSVGGLQNGICGDISTQSGVDASCHAGQPVVYVEAAGQQASTVASILSDALFRWNEKLREGGRLNFFSLAAGGGGTKVRLDATSSTGEYCGKTENVSEVRIFPASSTNCASSETGSLLAVVTHELGHVLGWNGGHGPPFAALSSVTGAQTGRCTMFIRPGFPVSANVCHHDAEPLFRARLAGGWSVGDDTLFAEELLVGTDAPDAELTVEVGESMAVVLSGWRRSPSFGLLTRSASDLSWSSNTTAVATVSSSGKIFGVSPGTAKVFMRAPASVAGFGVWTPFKDVGDSVLVRVIQPPPPSYTLRVDSVRVLIGGSLFSAPPLTSAGSYEARAFVSGAQTPIALVWEVVDSRAPSDTTGIEMAPTLGYGFSLSPGDSYSLTFKVTPLYGSAPNRIAGSYLVESVTICVPAGSGGGEGTNAVQGCGGGGGAGGPIY